jgi:hypothetical protein
MTTPVLLAVAALLCGITARRLCGYMCSRLRSRSCIEYLRNSINDANAYTIAGTAATAPQAPTGPRPRPAGPVLNTIAPGDRSIRISASPLFSEPWAAFSVQDHAGSSGTALGGPTWC